VLQNCIVLACCRLLASSGVVARVALPWAGGLEGEGFRGVVRAGIEDVGPAGGGRGSGCVGEDFDKGGHLVVVVQRRVLWVSSRPAWFWANAVDNHGHTRPQATYVHGQ
jgi:hypothetical protein